MDQYEENEKNLRDTKVGMHIHQSLPCIFPYLKRVALSGVAVEEEANILTRGFFIAKPRDMFCKLLRERGAL